MKALALRSRNRYKEIQMSSYESSRAKKNKKLKKQRTVRHESAKPSDKDTRIDM